MPLLRSDSVASNALTRYRGDFIVSFQNDSVALISLAAVLLTREVIDSETKNDVCSKQCQEGAGILFDNLEMNLEKNPEMLQIMLDIMKNEKCLCDIVEKIKSDSEFDMVVILNLLFASILETSCMRNILSDSITLCSKVNFTLTGFVHVLFY